MLVSTSLFGSAILLLSMIFLAGLLKYKAWTFQGMMLMMSNRDNVPDPTPIAGRADRAAKNMVENMVMFVALVVAIQLSGATINLHRWARAYFSGLDWLIGRPIYMAFCIFARDCGLSV